jgi:hypothetical protein
VILNITPLRLSVLRFLAERPSGYSAKGLVQELCPRDTRTGAWTEQGAARMAGKLVKPLREAGVLMDEQHSPIYRRKVRITDAGRSLLAEYDEAASRAQLEKSLASAT